MITTTNLFRELVESRLNSVWNSDNLGQIYLMKIQHLRGKDKTLVDTFYKIGYSGYKDLASRIAYMPSCYSVEVVASMIFDREQARHLEGLLHKRLRQFSYKPRHKKWGGVTEAYGLNLLDTYPDLKTMVDLVLHPEPSINSPYSLN